MSWKRAKDTFDGENNHLWGANGISPNDIRQGSIGNCWFLSSVSAYAELPGRVEKLFLNQESELNEAGIYGVNMYALGIPHTVIVDDYLPVAE